MSCSLTLLAVDEPTAGQMRRVSDFPAENVAAAGCRRSRCTPRSRAVPAHGSRSDNDAPAHSSACPRNSLSEHCYSSCPSDSWTPSCRAVAAASDSPRHNTASHNRSGGSIQSVGASPHLLAPRRDSPSPSSSGPPSHARPSHTYTDLWSPPDTTTLPSSR